jgi:DNA ligase-1
VGAVRDHTIERFGPARAVARDLVLEVAFDSVHRSTRHKSGLAIALSAHPPYPLG